MEIDIEHGSLIELMTVEKFIKRLVLIKQKIVYYGTKKTIRAEALEKLYSEEVFNLREYLLKLDEGLRDRKQKEIAQKKVTGK